MISLCVWTRSHDCLGYILIRSNSNLGHQKRRSRSHLGLDSVYQIGSYSEPAGCNKMATLEKEHTGKRVTELEI